MIYFSSGAIVPGGGQIASFGDTMFVAIPMDMIRRLSPVGIVHKQFQLRARYDRVDGVPASIIVMSKIFRVDVEPVQQPHLADLSSSPAGTEHEIEKQILSRLNFPVTPGGWSYGMGSDYHKGTGLFALDLNSTNDKGKPVFAAAEGKVLEVKLDAGKVVMQHTLPDEQIWTTTYFHMTHILEDVTGINYLGLKEADGAGADVNEANAMRVAAQAAIDALIVGGKVLFQGQTLGKVGNEGMSDGDHLHFQVNKGAEKTPVALFKWAGYMQPGFTVSGDVGGANMVMQWNDQANALVNYGDRIAMQRVNIVDDQGKIIGAENLAFAWEPNMTVGQMQRVVWVQSLSDGTKVNSWLKTDDFSQKWDTALHEFLPR